MRDLALKRFNGALYVVIAIDDDLQWAEDELILTQSFTTFQVQEYVYFSQIYSGRQERIDALR